MSYGIAWRRVFGWSDSEFSNKSRHSPLCGCHARVVEGVKPFKTVDVHDLPKVIFPSGQPCLEGKMTFGDPFDDSGVVTPDPIRSFPNQIQT